MRVVEKHVSPDALLALVVLQSEGGDIAVGFEGANWHTHPDLLALWLGVPERGAVSRFIELLLADQLPIIASTDGGHTFEPWVSDNLEATLRVYGAENCVLRLWSGGSVA